MVIYFNFTFYFFLFLFICAYNVWVISPLYFFLFVFWLGLKFELRALHLSHTFSPDTSRFSLLVY
jgi:hypothetical protein